ncbi:ATP-binding cassette domain-containing protein, partial [Synergistaceae bacterium OttesenSCG-928-I11]|nr:ATP-binding cassette domain-containing protein [Synergistaceae bacterium OttesenSCG-928-I11]
ARDMRAIVPVKTAPREPRAWLSVETNNYHNLGAQTIEVPTGILTVFCGVAGSGKTSLGDVVQRYLDTDVISISQKNVGISLRSTPATYLEIGDEIRRLFARENRVASALFSFNSKGGCPACKGKGVIVTDMAFMEDIVTVCEACNGMRYAPEVLGYLYRGKNIASVMDMTVTDALDFFRDMPFALQLRQMVRVGLDYLRLNQSLSTLSGGELQRLKLASNLDRKGSAYILDEPTSGLHMDDVKKLLRLFEELVEEGNTVIVMEHNLAVVKAADWLIELGPEGGDKGGRVLFSGPPSRMKEARESVTARYF